jgi:peptidoglycan/xylan/chitin deacetylase (PgdA/CDA1 family)
MSVVAKNWPIIVNASGEAETSTLKGFAEFWKIPYTLDAQDDNLPIISSGQKNLNEESNNRTVIFTPAGKTDADSFAKKHGLLVTTRTTTINLPIGLSAKVSVATEIFQFSGQSIQPVLYSDDISILSRLQGTSTFLLSLDLVGEYSKRLLDGFEERPSWKFKLASRLPFSYEAIPRFIRDRSFRSDDGVDQIKEENLGPIECLRTLFLASIVEALGPTPRVGFWRRGKRFALAVTHDVESQFGLETGASSLLEVENSLGIRSTWNIPSDRYNITPQPIQLLLKSGEIGGHDTRHDGRLIFLGRDEKIERLRQCRESLEKLTNGQIRGFRAPLLQHSSDLAEAEVKAGYAYDSSCPSWEILSPTSMGPHGAGTIFPFEISGLLEIPVSLPQDHQLIRVAGQSPSEAVDFLARFARWIKAIGGPCILLVHPDYEFATGNPAEYRRLLETFTSDPECDIMTMSELSDWWKLRTQAQWTMTDGKPSLSTVDKEASANLTILTVLEYGQNGFVTETSN